MFELILLESRNLSHIKKWCNNYTAGLCSFIIFDKNSFSLIEWVGKFSVVSILINKDIILRG